MMQYCIYLRKSRADLEAEEHGEGETLARHERALMDLAKKQKLKITKIYKEVVSGETITARPVMQQLLSDVEKCMWTGVLVMEVERLARGDTIDQGLVAQTFKYSDTKIITPMKSYNPNDQYDEEYFEFGLFMSRREYKTINRRLQAGRVASVKEGKWVGNKCPYGYKIIKLEGQKGFKLEIVPEEASIVKMIFELYTIGEKQDDGSLKRLGSTLISNKLNNMKICAAKGGPWKPQRILELLRNPAYVGKVRWNSRPNIKKMHDGIITLERPRADLDDWIITDGMHEAIIDEDLFYKTQDYLKNNKPRPAPSMQPIKNPLSGLIVCGFCGAKMTRRPYPGKSPDTLLCPTSGCKNISSYLNTVENKLLASLQYWLNDYNLKLDIENKQHTSNTEIDVKKQTIKKLENELVSLKKQISNIYEFLEKGIYTTEMFVERSKLLNEKHKEIKANLEILNNQLENDKKIEKNIVDFIPKAANALEAYHSIDDPEIKNQLLGEVISKIIYTKTKRVYNTGKFDNFELIVYPKVPK